MNTGHLILKNKIPVPFSLGINSYDIILSSHFLILFYALFSELYFVLCISLNKFITHLWQEMRHVN